MEEEEKGGNKSYVYILTAVSLGTEYRGTIQCSGRHFAWQLLPSVYEGVCERVIVACVTSW